MQEAAEHAPFTVRLHHPQHPHQRCPIVGCKQGVLVGESIDDRCQILAGNFAARTRHGPARLRFECLLVAFHIRIEECGIFALGNARQQRLKRVLDIPHHAEIDRMATANVGRINIDLDDLGVVRVKLAPRKIRTEKQQGVTV